jgi:hypothetical protein
MPEPKPRKARLTQERQRQCGFSLWARSIPASTDSEKQLVTRSRRRGPVDKRAPPYARQLRNDDFGKKSALLQCQYHRHATAGSPPSTSDAAVS